MKKLIGGIVTLCVIGGIFYAFNPAGSPLFPKCPFLMLTGWQCPGCGSQRAIHCLLHADIAGAFGYNAFMVLSLPIVAVLLYAECYRKRKPHFYIRIHRPAYILTYLALMIAWTMMRNVFLA